MIKAHQIHTNREERSPGLPASILSIIWSSLPILLFMDAIFFVAALPPVAIFFAGGSILAPLVVAVTLAPVWTGIVASTDRMIGDESVSVSRFIRNVRRYAWRGISFGIVPAVAATAALGTLAILRTTGERWLYVPLFVDGSVLVLCLLAAFSAFSLAATWGLSGWRLWRVSLGVAAARPMATLGTASLLVLFGFAVSVVPGMLPFLPAPFAVYLSALTWATIGREGGEPKLGRLS